MCIESHYFNFYVFFTFDVRSVEKKMWVVYVGVSLKDAFVMYHVNIEIKLKLIEVLSIS